MDTVGALSSLTPELSSDEGNGGDTAAAMSGGKRQKTATTPRSTKKARISKANGFRMSWTKGLEKALLELRFKDPLILKEFSKLRNNADRTNFWNFFGRRFNGITKDAKNRDWWEGSEPLDVPVEKLKDKILAIRKEYKLAKSMLEETVLLGNGSQADGGDRGTVADAEGKASCNPVYEGFLGKRMSYLWELANYCFQGRPGPPGEVLLNSRSEGGVFDDELKISGDSDNVAAGHESPSDASYETSHDEGDADPVEQEKLRRKNRVSTKARKRDANQTGPQKNPIELMCESVSQLSSCMSKALPALANGAAARVVHNTVTISQPSSSENDNHVILKKLLEMQMEQQKMIEHLTTIVERLERSCK